MMELKLLYAVLRERNHKLIFQIPTNLISQENSKYFQFSKEYYLDYKQLPEAYTVEGKFKIEFEETNDSSNFWYKEVKSKYEEVLVREAIKKAAKSKSLDPFKEALILAESTNNTQVQSYGQTALDRIENYYLEPDVLSTGSEELDELIIGYYRTDFIILGGEEGLGKTWWLLRRANALAKLTQKYEGRPVLLFSGEMLRTELEERLDCINTGTNYIKYQKRSLSEVQENTRKKKLKAIGKRAKSGRYNLIIIDDCFDLESVESYIATLNPIAVFIDGIPQFSKSLDWKDLMLLAMKTKKICKKHRTPIFATTHLRGDVKINMENANVKSFAYFKVARDVDLAFVMCQDDEMKVRNEIGVKCVKGRKFGGFDLYYQTNHETQEEQVIVD